MINKHNLRIAVTSFVSWHMDHAAAAYQAKSALAGLYISNNNYRGIRLNLYYRCWSFAFLMKPFYHFWNSKVEWAQYFLFMGAYNRWLKSKDLSSCNVIQAIAWGAKTPFDIAEEIGALKVLDSPNSYPTTYDAYERREMARYGKRIEPAIPSHIISQVIRDIDRADIILCPSQWVFDTMVSNGVPKEKCHINPFGVDTKTFIPRDTLPEQPLFVTVGSVRLRKGHQYLLPAFIRLKENYPEAKLIVVGEVHEDFKHLWPKWKNEIIHYSGLSHTELSTILRKCTAFILPSTEEGFARVILEAMASGLPILATYESGATTLVNDGEEGIIFKSCSIDAITNAMLYLLQNPQLIMDMGNKAAIKGGIRNTWQDYGDRNMEIFSKALSNKYAN